MTKKKRHTTTAAELLLELHSNPDFVARQQEQERVREKYIAQLRKAEAPLLGALKNVGLNIKSIWDLVNTSSQYDHAIPILLEHLQKSYPDKIKEGIARSLAIPAARSAWETLVAEFCKTDISSNPGTKDGLAVAIATTATDSVIDELVKLAMNKAHGESRILLLSALKKSKTIKAKQALTKLVTDPDLKTEIASWNQR